MTWAVEHLRGSASTLHEFVPPKLPERTVRVLETQSTALVIGSSQRSSDIDWHSACSLDVSIVRRSSGGGAVLLVPDQHVWIDVWLPFGDELWRDDVVAAADWLGDAFALALTDAQLSSVWVYRGPVSGGALSEVVCFLGRGPGEVFSGDKKVVGVSQRRTRDWIRFQTVLHRRFPAELTAALLAVPVDSEAVEQWRSQVYEIEGLPILELLRARLPQ